MKRPPFEPRTSPQRSDVDTKPFLGPAAYFHLVTLRLCLYLVNVEVTTLSTSLVAITNDLDGFCQIGWLVSGYLVTYSPFIVLLAKLSDLLGRKSSIIGAVGFFTCFSAGCGVAQSMPALLACRALKGIGAAECHSMAMIAFFEAGPPRCEHDVGGDSFSIFHQEP
ncbi:major facilitator superfamily protein [Hirsutella rhossiliensis]|uniref:Major facilitator superfamily domain-containing protein n=1 Tax=Hirsutella rhossiliensis TaxID=111463 RepID=A0A9P8MMU6_9HYPO|nr:major facilitator superfamily domain-containing protein [Hirsutella rhossiliensis]KAH0958045.1 major facilitator superfamily domain-containing protein [Hirsutella rhossiliensis]